MGKPVSGVLSFMNKLLMFRAVLAVMGAALALYSLWCILFLHYNIGNFLPGVLGVALLALAVYMPQILKYTASGPALRLRRFAAGLALITGLGFLAMLAGVYAYAGNVPRPGHDAVLILGGGLVDDEKPQGFRARLNTAIIYLEANPAAVAVVSGGQGRRDNISAAYAMRRYLIAHGIDETRIILEDQAGSTLENFVFAQKLLDEYFGGRAYSLVYVTNNFHLLRAGMLARHVGIEGEGLAAPSQIHMLPNYFSREYLAMIRAILVMMFS